MNHHPCTCTACKPTCPPVSQAVLLPRIIARGRTWLHRGCFTLRIDGLPCQAAMPCTLLSVCVAGEASWTQAADVRPLHYLVEIPLACQLRDACGGCWTAQASIAVELCLTAQCPLAECWRSQLMLLPCVRLVCATCLQECTAEAQLEVCLEGYLVRWEPHATGQPCKPKCPELPLYPQPCCP